LSGLIFLWESDGYSLKEIWRDEIDDDSIWILYVTEFDYQSFEYRRHTGILVEVENRNCESFVKRSRILDLKYYGPYENELIHEAENIRDMKWKTVKELES
jgi:hypothetical protein